MKKIQLAKNITRAIVGFGAGAVTKAIIQNNTEPEGKVDKVTYAAGSYALAGIASVHAANFANTKFEEMFPSSKTPEVIEETPTVIQ